MSWDLYRSTECGGSIRRIASCAARSLKTEIQHWSTSINFYSESKNQTSLKLTYSVEQHLTIHYNQEL